MLLLTYYIAIGANEMSIQYAILGLLSWGPLSGYEMKKIIQESPFMPWSGNNNQIYKALVELQEDDYTTNEIFHQEHAPSKKVYTITDAGQEKLKAWLLSAAEPPEFKKTFLLRLAWADQLSEEELLRLITGYEQEIRLQILLQEGHKGRPTALSPTRSARESVIWEMINANIVSSYQTELKWTQKLRETLCPSTKEVQTMQYRIIEKNEKKYIEVYSAETQLRTEEDGHDLVTVTMEQDTNLILLNGEVLSDDFFELRTGLAGKVLQKFVNYRIRTAIVIDSDQRIKGKFKALIAEAKNGKDFSIFDTKAAAEDWLLQS